MERLLAPRRRRVRTADHGRRRHIRPQPRTRPGRAPRAPPPPCARLASPPAAAHVAGRAGGAAAAMTAVGADLPALAGAARLGSLVRLEAQPDKGLAGQLGQLTSIEHDRGRVGVTLLDGSQAYAGPEAVRAAEDVRRPGEGGGAESFDVLLGPRTDENLLAEAGTYKVERVITSPQASEVTVQASQEPVLNFCANNYLGLSNHPALVEAAQKAIASHGFGLSSVRFICGTQDLHKKLEEAISRFHGTEDTILFPSCFDANAGLFEACLGPEDAVISDALNHASIIDGIRLCKAQRYRYGHMDMAHLEDILKECAGKGTRHRMIVTDGVFSMDGDIAPLKEICDLAERYDAQVFVDECHATGFLGKTGRGTPQLCGVEGRVDVINSTLGKALGGATGGYTTGPRVLIDLLRNKARPYLFSNTLAPSVAGASIEVFRMLSESSDLVEKLQSNVRQFRTAMASAGFKLSGHENCPIVPVMLGDARLASEFADEMLSRGIYVIGFSYPVVPKGAARIRVQLSAAHDAEQVQRCIDAFVDVGRAKGVIG